MEKIKKCHFDLNSSKMIKIVSESVPEVFWSNTNFFEIFKPKGPPFEFLALNQNFDQLAQINN